jgi:hypothetical protein
MAIYRALKALSGLAKRGQIVRLAHLDEAQIERLITVGAVAPIAAPPLAELPKWKTRAAKLKKLDVIDVEQLLEVDPAAVAVALDVKPETVAEWQAEAERFLTVE